MLAKLLGRCGEHRAGGECGEFMRSVYVAAPAAHTASLPPAGWKDRRCRGRPGPARCHGRPPRGVGQAQSQVHRLLEAGILQHRQALVVVHRQHGRSRPAWPAGRRCRPAAGRPGPCPPRAGAAAGDDQVQFLASQMAVFAGMRVQPEHRDARRRQAELAQRGMHRTQGVFQAGRGDRIGHPRSGRWVVARPRGQCDWPASSPPSLRPGRPAVQWYHCRQCRLR